MSISTSRNYFDQQHVENEIQRRQQRQARETERRNIRDMDLELALTAWGSDGGR